MVLLPNVWYAMILIVEFKTPPIYRNKILSTYLKEKFRISLDSWSIGHAKCLCLLFTVSAKSNTQMNCSKNLKGPRAFSS